MIRSESEFRHYGIRASDGDIGQVVKFFFDEIGYGISYLVIDTSGFFNRKQVLLSPSSIKSIDEDEKKIEVNLSRSTLVNSPDVDAEQPITRQNAEMINDYYGWNNVSQVRAWQSAEGQPEERHLVSTSELAGYHVQTGDGSVGHVEDFMIDDQDWVVRYLVVNTRDFLPGKNVLISPRWVENINWMESNINVSLDRERIRHAPGFDRSQPVTSEYERILFDYYGKPMYLRDRDIEELVRVRARELCEDRGCQPGHELDDWIKAEEIVVKELRMR